jgi:hypothetical protein
MVAKSSISTASLKNIIGANSLDGGKDSGQKLTDVSHRSAARPCNPSPAVATIVHNPHTAHPTDDMGIEVFTKPLASLPV